MPTEIKAKSVSVEDLGSIVKQMINGALENNAQVAKLHQAIYEEWYFKKLAELKCSEVKKAQEDLIQNAEQKHSIQSNTLQKNNLCENDDIVLSNISTNLVKENKSTELQARSQTFSGVLKDNKSKSLTSLHEHQTVTELRNTDNHVAELQNSVISNDAKSELEIIEVWNSNKTQKTKLCKNDKHNPKTDRNMQNSKMKCKDQSDINRLAFEAWKKEKNIKYKQLLKQKQKEKQKEVEDKLEEIEFRKAAQTYIHIQKQASQQKRKLSKEAQAIEQKNLKSSQEQAEMKRILNEKVFKEWKRQKDIKLREQKMMNNAYQQYANHFYHQQQQQQQQSGNTHPLQNIDTKFNLWLNQLDWVLHEKYLRERRYLVRSFYCQPAYYGNAADIVYAKHS